MAEADELIELIDRSSRFDNDLRNATSGVPVPEGLRYQAAVGWATASLEHGRGLRALMLLDNPCASFALLRPQMEAFIRQVWVCLVPDDEWLAEFFNLKDGDIRETKEPPGLTKAMREISEKGLEPFSEVVKALVDMLGDSHHSFTHNGARAVQMALRGAYRPAQFELVKLSNAFSLNAAAQIVDLCNLPAEKTPDLHGIAARYKDCFLGDGPPPVPGG
ncbi:DUF6988 family protein [Arenimonas aestuarii]